MQKRISTFIAAFLAVFFFSVGAKAQTTVSIYCTGTSGSYNSGSVNASGVKYDGNLDSVSFGATAPYYPAFRGWAEFDLSSLPAGATITNVTLYFTTYNGTTSSGASNPITGFLGDASILTGINLFNAIANGTALNATIWTANGLQTASLGTAGNTFVQNNIGSAINIGFQRAGYLPYHIYGYPGTTADQPRLDITFTVSTACSSITSVTANGPSTTCAGSPVTISSATLPYAAGYTFQWQSSPSGANTWTAIPNETNSSLTTTQTSATDYQVVVTCPATSTTMTSNTVAVAQTNFNSCYCPATVSYVANEDITNVTLGVINNNTACGSLTGSQGTATGGADIYSDFTSSTVPVPTLMVGTSQTLNVTLNTCSGTSNIRECKAYIDYNQNGLFTDAGEEIIVYASANPNVTAYAATVNFTVPATASLGNTRMRILLAQGSGAIINPCQVLNNYGEAEDYTVNISALVNCTGTPTAGSVSGPSSVCNNSNFSLSATGASTTNGVTYQWQSSATGNPGTWSDISGANTTNLSATQTAPTYYRMYATCTATGSGDTTAGYFVDAALFYTCYCASGPTTSFYSDITNVTIGSFNNASTCNTVAPGPGSVQNRYSNYTSGTGAPVAPQLQHSFPLTFAIDITECSSFGAYSGTAVFIDYDQSGTFDAGEIVYGNTATVYGNHTVTGSFSIPSTAFTGLTGMRIANLYYTTGSSATACNSTVYAGETEDYLIDIIPPPNCSGTPTAGTISSNVTALCTSSLDTVRFTTLGTTAAGGLVYQWQESPTGTPGSWNDIGGATDLNFKTTQIATNYYRMYVSCIYSPGASDTTNALMIDMLPFYACYCSPRLGTTLHTCCGNYISNVTISSTNLNNSTTTYGNGYYTFYDTTTLSQTGAIAQGVSYTINVTCPYTGYGADVWIDWDQSGTFDNSEHIPTTTVGTVATATISVPYTSFMGYTGMRVRNNWGSSYGAGGACSGSGGYETEDYVVNVLPQPNCMPPSALTVSNLTSSSADISWTVNSFASQWQIEYGPTPFAIGSGTLVTTSVNPYSISSLIPNTPYTYYVRDICGPNDTSAWTTATFTTPCLPVTTLPWNENFDAMTTVGNTYFPSCWVKENGDWMTTSSATYTAALSSPNYLVDAWSATNEYIWLPGFQLTANVSYDLSFYVAGDGATSWTVDVFENTAQNSSGATQVGATYIVPGTTCCSVQPYAKVTVTLLPFVTEVYYYGIRVNEPTGGPYYVAFDDFRMEITPTCPSPTPSVSNITATSADLSWISNGSAIMSEIEWGSGNTFAIGTGTRVSSSAVTNPYSLINLTPGAQYSFFVRDICGPGDTSAWSIRTSFFTLPPNDLCSGAITVWSGSETGNNTAATDDPLTSLPTCTGSSTGGYYKGLWYSFTPTASGSVTVATCGTTWDTYLRIFDGSCGSLSSCVAYDDDGCAPASTVTFTAAANTTYYVLVAGYGTNSFGTFTLTVTGQPLASRLDKITASNIGTSNRIEWNTLSEEHGDRFELERSADGKNFLAIYEKAANGESSRYTYMDNNPVKGFNYYRLRMIEANGNTAYSEVVKAFVKSTGFEVEAYPNPVSHDLTVKVNGVQGTDAKIHVMDVTGKVIRVMKMNSSIETIDMSHIANGIYLIKYSDASHTQIIRVTKQ